jgi:hypothetical protein
LSAPRLARFIASIASTSITPGRSTGRSSGPTSLIAQGRVVIKAIDSIVAAGLDEMQLPKLAIVRADAEECFWLPTRGGGGAFAMTNSWARDREHQSRRIVIAEGTWPEQSRSRNSYRAVAPLIPIHLRPKRGLQNYHVLWEAEWRPAPPLDPLLLRRIGVSDLWGRARRLGPHRGRARRAGGADQCIAFNE